MNTKLRFFKQDNKWYADVANHTLDENEMVMGSDIVLDLLSKENDEVALELSDKYDSSYIYRLHMIEHDEDGAYYEIWGNIDFKEYIWICNVTHDVFGEHPDDIYILSIDTNGNDNKQRVI